MSTHSMQYCIALCALVGIVSCTYVNYGSCDSFDAEKLNEGWCPHRYQDSLGIWTIAVGFNLEQSSAQTVLANCGGNYAALNAGPNNCHYNGVNSQIISNDTASCLLGYYLQGAASCVMTILGNSFNTVPRQVISGMVDMAYNMGCAGLKQFNTMHSQITSGDYGSAAKSAQASKWCGQIGSRCTRTTACIGNGGASSSPPTTGNSPPSGGCYIFKAGLCPGTSSCQCALGTTCPSKASAKLAVTEVFNATKREMKSQGSDCATQGGTCYNVVHGQCGGGDDCLQAGDRC